MEFCLESTSGRPFKLSEITTPLVIFFYPRDNTPGCTIENQDFSRLYPEFVASGYEVVGISRDKHKTHCNFQAKFGLTHHLLADPEETVCQMFNVMKNKTMYGKPVRGIERSTFILDNNKQIIKEWRKVTVTNHAQEVLEYIRSELS
jgi:peroxiredoxin Q/BCP